MNLISTFQMGYFVRYLEINIATSDFKIFLTEKREGAYPRNLTFSTSNSRKKCPQVISSRISPIAFACVVSRLVEVVNDYHILNNSDGP